MGTKTTYLNKNNLVVVTGADGLWITDAYGNVAHVINSIPDDVEYTTMTASLILPLFAGETLSCTERFEPFEFSIGDRASDKYMIEPILFGGKIAFYNHKYSKGVKKNIVGRRIGGRCALRDDKMAVANIASRTKLIQAIKEYYGEDRFKDVMSKGDLI